MPLCNTSTAFITQDIFPDRATERKILSLCIKCSSSGCDWTGELREKEVIFNYSQLLTYSFITFTNTNATIFLLLYLNHQILLFLHNQHLCIDFLHHHLSIVGPSPTFRLVCYIFKYTPCNVSKSIWLLSFHQLCIHMHVFRTTCERNTEFLGVTSHSMWQENKIGYKLKRSIDPKMVQQVSEIAPMITATVKRISMFGFYQDHLLSCSFKLISCPNVNCAVKTTRQKMDEHVATVCEWRMVTCDHCSEPHPKCLLQVSFNDKEFAQMHGINKYTDIKIVVINMAIPWT